MMILTFARHSAICWRPRAIRSMPRQRGPKPLPRPREVYYGAVLLDIGGPDLDGHAVLRSLREANPTLPVIIVTGYVTEQNTVGPLTKGAWGYVTKPYRPAEIKAVLRRAIEVRAEYVRG